MKKIIFVYEFICEIEGTNNANVFLTRKSQLLCQYWKNNNTDEDKFLTGIGSGENGDKFKKGTDQVSGGTSDYGRPSNGVAAKIQFHYASKKIVTSRTIWLDNPNKIANLEVKVFWFCCLTTVRIRLATGSRWHRSKRAPVHSACGGRSHNRPLTVSSSQRFPTGSGLE